MRHGACNRQHNADDEAGFKHLAEDDDESSQHPSVPSMMRNDCHPCFLSVGISRTPIALDSPRAVLVLWAHRPYPILTHEAVHIEVVPEILDRSISGGFFQCADEAAGRSYSVKSDAKCPRCLVLHFWI